MKQVIFALALLMVGMTASAQGTWDKRVREADPLKGIKEGMTYIYTQEDMGCVIIYGWEKPLIRIYSSNGIFNINSGGWVESLVGFYNANNELIEKTKLWFHEEHGSGYTFAMTVSNQKKKVAKIMRAMQTIDGYVRIIVPRYNGPDFDIKVIHYSE